MANIWDELEKQAFEPNKKEAAPTGSSVWDTLEAEAFGGAPKQSVTSNRFSAAIDQYQAGLLGAGEAVTGALGFTGAEEALRDRRIQNEYAAEKSLTRAREQGAVESYKDVGSLSDAGSYVAGLAIQSAPYAAEALVGGLGARAVMGGTRAALTAAAGDVAAETAARQALTRGSQIGAAAASYPSAVGDVLNNQRQQTGGTDISSALGLAIPYAALNVVGVEGALAKGQLFRSTGSLLDDLSGAKGGLARAAATGVKTGAAESFSETAQEGINQFGRMVVDPNEQFASPQAIERFKESAVGGFVLGGAAGSLGGGFRRSEGSFLPGSTDSGDLDVSNKPDNNAINKAIDANSTEIATNTNQQITAVQQAAQAEQEFLQAKAADEKVRQEQADIQAKQQAQEAFTQVAQTYGLKPGAQAGQFNVAGKILFTQNDAVNFLKSLDELNAGKTEEQKGIIGATLASGAVKVNADANPKTINNAVNKFLTGFGLDSAVNKTEAAERANTIISTMEGGTTLKKAEPLNNFYRSVTGQDAPAFAFLVQQTETAKPTKGASNEQLRVQDNAGLRAVSEQGGATETSGNQPGNIRPPSVQSIESGSVNAGSLGLQTGAVPSSGVSTSTGGNGSRTIIPGQGNGTQEAQINEAQRTGSDQEGRGALSGQAIEGNRTPEQQAEETATNIVESVIKGVIDAVVTRKGRMSKENLAKLKEFIYYDASQIEDQKNGLPGLSKKELSEMFGVSTDVIDGWQDIARNFFEQNRGVIQAQIYQALDKNGITLLELKEAVQAKRDTTLNDAIILEEGQRAEPSTKDDEQAAKTKAGKAAAAADQELTEVDESQLDQRDLGAEDSGMTVMKGRKGISVQEYKPEETINAKYLRKTKELEKAENAGDEELVAKLNKELNDLVDEAAGVAKKQIAKSEAIASEKKKETKNAVQKRSTEGVSVRKQSKVSEGVPSKDTEGDKAATEGKTDEESSSLTVEEYFDTKKNLQNKYDELQKTYDGLDAKYWDLEFKNKDDERAKVKAERDAVAKDQDSILAQLEKLTFKIDAKELADKKKYDARRKEIEAEEKGLDTYLSDVGVDNENAYPLKEGEAGYWSRMLASQETAYEMRKQELADKAKTDTEQAAQAWDRVAKRYPEAPLFADLTKEQQKDWISYGKENWTSDDVQTELVKLAKQSLRTPAKNVQESFSENNPLIDPLSEEVDAALRGKTMREAMNWALDNVRNEYERMVLRAVDARMRELTALGMEFSFKLTDPGKQLTGGMLGVSTLTPGGLGQAQRVEIILNGAHTGEKAGTNYETLAHELIHAVTQGQLRISPDGTASKELQALYKEVVSNFNKKAKAGTLNEFETKFFKRENNSLETADELLAWGLTNKEFQEYLASVEVSPKVSLWDKFVKAIAGLLSIPVKANSALARLMAVSEELLAESVNPYVKESNKRFQSFGKQANPTTWPDWSINPELGAPVWVEGDYALYKATGSRGGTLFIPGSRKGDTSATGQVDVKDFTGYTKIPASMVAKMQVVADGLRTQTSAMVSKASLDKVRAQAKTNLDKIPASIRGPFRAIHDALFNAKETALSVLLTIDVAKLASKYMPSAMDYYEINNKRTAIESAITEKLDKILVTAQDELNAADRKVVNRLIEDSTISGKWAFDPNIAGVTDKDIDPELAARFKAIGNPKAKQVIRDVFKFWNQTLQQEQEAIRTEIDATFAERLANATETEKKAIEARKKDVLDKFSAILKAKANNPYAPLKRFGPFVVVAKSQEYIDAEKNLDSKWLKENQGDEKHYVVEFAETSSEAEAMYDSLKKLGYDQVEKPFKKSESKDVLYSSIDLYKAFTQLKKTISSEKAVSSTAESVDLYSKMNELVDELYLMSLSENSARKSELQRKGVAGLNRALNGVEARDMLRATFSQGAAKAKYIANLKTNDESLQTMIRMQKEAQSNRAEAYPYLNELIAREAQSLQVRERSMLDGVNRMTGDWFLTFSPGFYFQQAAQTYVLSVPWLAGKVGGNYGKAFGAVTAAYKDIMPLVKGTKLREHIDFSKAPKDVREMLENLVSRGAINIGIESELLSHRSINENVVTATYNKVTNKLRGGINRIEAINRASAATAAYRLEMAKSGSKEKATQAAFDVVKETHGLYDGSNAPRLFNKNAFTRSIFQFRRFQIIQLTTLARIMKDAVAGAGPLEKAIARKQFAFMIGHSLALAGVKGLPLYGLASLAYTLGKAAFGDEDDPKDFEAWLRTHGGLLLARGIPAFMGVDVSGKLGQGNVTSVLPYTDIDLTSRGGIEKLVIGLAGPFAGGLLPKMADGVGLMADGQYYKGLEQVLPNGFGGAMKGARFATEGITTRRGDLVMSPDEISFADGMMQALGLPTTKLSERQYLQGQLIKTDQFYNDKATEIKGSYTRAVKEGDTEAKREAQDSWKSLQASRKENGYTVQPLSVLLKAPQEQKKRERNTVGGVAVTKSNKGFAQRTSEQ